MPLRADDTHEKKRRLPLHASSEDAARPASDGRPLRVGELAKRTGKTVRALHLYEEIGVLEPARRTDAGYRLYSADSVTRVEWITRLQDAGLSLPEIRDLLASWGSSGSAPTAMKKVTELYARKLEETRAQIARLRELESELVRSLDYLATCDTCEPQRVVASCPSCDRHECDPAGPDDPADRGDQAKRRPPPVLVAGFHPPASE